MLCFHVERQRMHGNVLNHRAVVQRDTDAPGSTGKCRNAVCNTWRKPTVAALSVIEKFVSDVTVERLRYVSDVRRHSSPLPALLHFFCGADPQCLVMGELGERCRLVALQRNSQHVGDTLDERPAAP